MDKQKQVQTEDALKLAVEAGRILLKNGAEIFRVGETIEHICNHYNVEAVHYFILSNGIFISVMEDGKESSAMIRHIPLASSHLGIVNEVNDLSRQICEGKVTYEDAWVRLKEIETIPIIKYRYRVLAAGAASGFFCLLMGATFLDSVFATMIGMIMYVLYIIGGRCKLSKLIINTVEGAFITLLAIGCYQAFPSLELNLDKMIIGAILPLVPGLAFVNAIRDIANSDFLSGTIRMIDALLVFVYVAVGVGTVLSIFNGVLGGAVL